MENDTLRLNQRKAIEGLLNGLTKGQAAAAAGCQPPTLSRWLATPEFRKVLTQQSNDALKNAGVRLTAAIETAVSLLQETMTNEEIHEGVRLRAADMVLTHAVKMLEITDILERLEDLESRLNET